jgi:hypothetical protein
MRGVAPCRCKAHRVGLLLNQEHSAALLDEFAEWLGDDGEPNAADTVSAAEMFVDWRCTYSNGLLDDFTENDIVEFLLEWCPRKYSAGPDDAWAVCQSVGTFLEFLGETDKLAGGRERALRLAGLADDLAPDMHDAMADPANFGLAKSILSHPAVNPPGLPPIVELLAHGDPTIMDDLEAELQARLAVFNGLPIDERKVLIDLFMEPPPSAVELPFLHIPPAQTDVETAAGAAPLLGKIDALRDYLGPTGKPLTARGNIRRADGRALIALLDTGDEMDPQIGDRTFRTSSTAELPGLTQMIEVAKAAGAVRVTLRRLVPVKTWWRRSATERATSVYRAILDIGPLWSRRSRGYPLFDDADALLDDGIVHWLAGLLAPDAEVPLDDVVALADEVLAGELGRYWPRWSDDLGDMARRGVSRIFEVLVAAGVVEWSDSRQVPTSVDSYPTGGTVRLTALGRHVVPDDLPDAGYMLRRLDDLADAPASALIEALDWVPDDQRHVVAAGWQPRLDVADRVQLIVDAIGSTEDPAVRLRGFSALELFDPPTVGPIVRALLLGPTAGHAALWLLGHDMADEAEVGKFVDIGVFIDVLAATLDDPQAMCDLFGNAPRRGDQFATLERMWRHPAIETQLVLDALGEHLPDRTLAKAARKAAMRHRSWMANKQ